MTTSILHLQTVSRPSLRRGFGRVHALLRLWARRRRQRLELVRLDAHLLRDIGITPEQARRQGGKPFWRA